MGAKHGEPERVKPGEKGYEQDAIARRRKKAERVRLEALKESAKPCAAHIHNVGKVRI